MSNVRIYVGTYAKYNEGSLFGEWVDLTQFPDLKSFYNYISSLHSDEEDPEFMFQDWECSELITGLDLIGESYLSEDVFKVLELVEQSSYEESVWVGFVNCFGESDLDELQEKIEESYCGGYGSDEDFVQELLEQCGDLQELPSHIHIDWTGTARDIMMDFCCEGGHYFRLS